MRELDENPLNGADGDLTASDAAQRSLSDALRISFALLRLLIVVLLAVFLLSGMFKVKTGEVAVRLHFGELVATEGQDTFYKPGGPYFAWPEPMDTVIRVPVSERTMDISRAFWFNVHKEDQGKPLDELPVPQDGLDPDQDGFLLTADRNIMHGRWALTWKVNEREAADFIRTVSARSNPREMIDDAERVLKLVAEQAIVATVAEHTADQFYLGTIDWNLKAGKRMQTALQKMESGILVTNVSLTEYTAPLAVRHSFLAVDQAQSARNQAIITAETERARMLGESAGEAHPVILSAVEYYERLLRRNDAVRAGGVEKAMAAFFEGAPASECFKPVLDAAEPSLQQQLAALRLPVRISGKAYDTIEKARGAAASATQAVQRESQTFTSRLKQYQENPAVVRDRLWQETLNELFAGDAERFYLPPGSKDVYLDLNRDPSIKKRKEREMYEEQQKRGKK